MFDTLFVSLDYWKYIPAQQQQNSAIKTSPSWLDKHEGGRGREGAGAVNVIS